MIKYGCFVALFVVLILQCSAKRHEAATKSFERAVSFRILNPSKTLFITDSLLSVRHQNEVPQWEIWNLQATTYLQIRQTTQAIKAAQKADSCYQLLMHTPNPEANRIMAISYKDKGDLPKALLYYQQAINHSTDTLSRLNNVFNMAEIELAAGDTLSAAKHLKSNIQQVRLLGKSVYAALFYMQYAMFLTSLNRDAKTALSYYLLAVEILEKNNEFERAGFAASGVAKTYQKLNRTDSCRWWFDKALRLQQKSGRPLGLSDVYINMADYELENMKYKKALYFYLKAYPYVLRADYLPMQTHLFKQLGIAYEKNGDYVLGIRFLKKYNELTDSVEKQRWQEKVAELQVKYSIIEKDQELMQLQNKIGWVEKVKWIFVFGALVFLLGGLFVFFRFSKNKKTKIHKIESENIKNNTPGNDRIELWLELKHLLENEHVYRDPDLNLNSLALKMKTNRTTLSEVINNHGSRSFSNLINHYRITEACELLKNPSAHHFTIEGVGLNTGFKSRSAFYAAFIAETDETPSSFRKKYQTNNDD